MMAYEQKPNTGSLFKNDRKESDTHADYKGSALINGVEHWLDAWINESSSGAKYMSLKFKPKEARSGYAGSYNGDPATNSSGSAGPQDDYPF
jgi:hypothetical protein